MSLSASRLSPLVIAASPTTTAIRSVLPRRSRAAARPCPIESPVPACPPSNTSCSRLAPPREAADAAELAERPEPLEAAGQELVRIGLVAGVPDDPVARRLEQPVERDRELDDAEAAAEVAAGRRDGRDDRLADLGGEPVELGGGQAAEVGRAVSASAGSVAGRSRGRWLQVVARWRRHRRASAEFAPPLARIGARIVNVYVRKAARFRASGCGRSTGRVPRARRRCGSSPPSERRRMWDRGAEGP